ncbi:hypothetical protein Vretimale_654, partial [Volvox reticuliferus]
IRQKTRKIPVADLSVTDAVEVRNPRTAHQPRLSRPPHRMPVAGVLPQHQHHRIACLLERGLVSGSGTDEGAMAYSVPLATCHEHRLLIAVRDTSRPNGGPCRCRTARANAATSAWGSGTRHRRNASTIRQPSAEH